MGKTFLAILSGTVFGFGLALSGMMNPRRVRGFLDLFGEWDPTLAFVMGGAVLVMAVAWLLQGRMARPAAGAKFDLPGTTKLDGRLIGGSAMFGAGWGLAGLCPGPAIASIGTQFAPALIFVISMGIGSLAFRIVDRDHARLA